MSVSADAWRVRSLSRMRLHEEGATAHRIVEHVAVGEVLRGLGMTSLRRSSPASDQRAVATDVTYCTPLASWSRRL